MFSSADAAGEASVFFGRPCKDAAIEAAERRLTGRRRGAAVESVGASTAIGLC